jgi:hypothetical protein
MNSLSPERGRNESRRNYVARRKAGNIAVKRVLKGKMVHQSVHFATVPQGDEIVSTQVLQGKARIVSTVLGPKGETRDVVRFKGTTYRRPTPKAPSKRDRWRGRKNDK